jgi:hypothetical protein
MMHGRNLYIDAQMLVDSLDQPYRCSFTFMDRIPSELWTKIFSFACLDDGTTGRTLSVVSNYVHHVSKPAKFQSIVLRGLHQTVAFLALLQATPEHHRRVYHLFAYESHEDFGFFGERQWIEDSMSDVLNKILHIVSPTLQTLAIRFDHSSMCPLYPLELPVLEELTIFSTRIDYSYIEPITPLPRLKQVHYAGKFGQYDLGIFSALCELAPHLTHFRYSGIHATSDVALDLEAVVDGNQSSSNCSRLPATVSMVVVQPDTMDNHAIHGPHYIRMVAMLKRLAQRGRDRGVIVLPADDAHTYLGSWKAIEAEWLDRIHGGQGCWDENSACSVALLDNLYGPLMLPFSS